MRLTGARLAALALALLVDPAAACDLAAGDDGKSPLQTRKPILGEDVRLTSGFGMRKHPLLDVPRLHTGVDWAAPIGTQVVAAGTGRVLSAEPKGEYGNAIVIDHGASWQTFYSQLSSFDVKEGDCVPFGAPIGKVGTTGLSSGPHLHFEVRRDGKPIDPMLVALKSAPPDGRENK